jgi:chromate transporter
MRGLAALAFVAIFVLDVPFPLIVLAAALIGFFGGRAGCRVQGRRRTRSRRR